MAGGDWNILAGRLVGDGSIDILETELPMEIASIDRNLSAPSMMSGSITNSVKRLKKGGRPLFEPWNTVIIAEAAGLIRGMTIYRKPTFTGAKWELDQIGLPGYAQGTLYDGSASFVNTDPLDIFRHVWDHLQGFPAGNLGITVDRTARSPVRVGQGTPDPVDFDQARYNSDPAWAAYWDGLKAAGWAGKATDSAERLYPPANTSSTDSEPRKLNWWETSDLGTVIDDLAKETPFDWLEKLSWQGDQPHCHLDLGYPTLGGRKDHLRLVLGENLATEPDVTEADYFNQVHVMGAGEGRDRVRGYAGVADGRLRRTRVVDDKSRSGKAQADSLARDELNATRGQLVVDMVEVYDHPNARLEAIELGDEIPLYAETDWVTVDCYVRVVGKSESPDKSDSATLTVVRMAEA